MLTFLAPAAAGGSGSFSGDGMRGAGGRTMGLPLEAQLRLLLTNRMRVPTARSEPHSVRLNAVLAGSSNRCPALSEGEGPRTRETRPAKLKTDNKNTTTPRGAMCGGGILKGPLLCLILGSLFV